MAASDGTPTAYGAANPGGDNLLNDFVQENATSFAAFGNARGDRVARVENVATLVDAGSRLPFSNRAVLERPVDDIRSVLDHIRPFYDSGSDTAFLLDSAWPTPDLRPVGFELMGHPPLMVRPAGEPFPQPPPELRIVRVDDERTAYDYEHTLIYGYPAPPLQPMHEVTIMTPGALGAAGWQHFVGYVDDQPVAAGSGYAGERLVRVDNIATMEAARGRGYGFALTAVAAAIDSAKPATLIASDLGRPVYERLGFTAVLRFTYWLGLRTIGSARTG
jgi:GNAT superfamily N-acetyltransferase